MDLVPPLPKSGRLWKGKADFFRPFRTAASEAGENIIPLYDPNIARDEPQEPDLRELNAALSALVDIFPDVQPEVFREMLVSVSGESRLQVVTEHLVQKKAKWVQGRFRTQPKQESSKSKKQSLAAKTTASEQGSLENEDLFRGDGYKKAVKQVFYQEFKNLSHSTIKGVLAEQNFSYTLARPILQQVSNRSWRFSLTGFWSKRSPSSSADGHPFVVWQTKGSVDGPATPAIRRTGNAELDRELFELFVGPVISQQRQDRLYSDFVTANEINEAEAEDAEALFDCDCCYSSVPFEKIATCDGDCHYLCLDCIRRTVNEALYGQGWSRAADLRRATVRCFSTSCQDCSGCIPNEMVRRALTQGSENEDAWHDFQARVTTETLLKCGLPLQRCPFCSYAEVDEPPPVNMKHPMAIWAHVCTKTTPAVQIIFLSLATALAPFTIPLLALAVPLWLLAQIVPPMKNRLRASVIRVVKYRRGIRFSCQHPSCSKTSCTRCLARWQDPHACFESEKTSLRTAIEASATAAVKRTCPRCMLSFVKSSGCNKLVCNCGYTMCYICRQEITSKEGYAHFCQHFRPNGGRCADCERCDLYGDEDEEAAIRRAAEAAEKAWRNKEGRKDGDTESSRLMIDALIGQAKRSWYDDYLDAVVDAVIA